MGLYIKIRKSRTEEFEQSLRELEPLCEQIDGQQDPVLCFPARGNLMNVVQFLSDRNLKFEVDVQDE